MTWIRSPSWDGFWILSGIPLGAALTGMVHWVPHFQIVFWVIVLTQTAHLLSPMMLAWSNDGFRPAMLRRPTQFVLIPIAVLGAATLAAYIGSLFLDIQFNPVTFAISTGPTTLEDLKNPFEVTVLLYALWNAYHFGMQAFGVMSIYRHRIARYDSRQRRIDLVYCCFVVWTTMLIPFVPRLAKGTHALVGWPTHPHPVLDYVRPTYGIAAGLGVVFMLWREWRSGRSLPRVLFILTDGLGMIFSFWAGFWGLAIVALNHWLVAIGLASHAHANRRNGPPTLYAGILMATGAVVFCALFVDVSQLMTSGPSPGVLRFAVVAVGFRLGLGFVHFLYDRWIYKFSDPVVRSTIGRDVLGKGAAT